LKRLTTLDKWLVLILVPLYAVCLVLGLMTQIQGGGGFAHLRLSLENAESYPAVTGEYDSLYSSNPLEEAGLRPGDRLVSVGGADLRGVGSFGFLTRVRVNVGPGLSIPLVYERDGERRETNLSVVPYSILRPWLAASFAFAASALLLLLRARPTPMVRAYFHFGLSLAFALGTLGIAPASYPVWYALLAIYIVSSGLVNPLMLRFAFLFPDDIAPQGRLHRVWPWFFGVLPVFNAIYFAGLIKFGTSGTNATILLGCLALVGVMTRKYRRADRVARRQIKWVVFGAYCALIPAIVATALATFDPRFVWLFVVSTWAFPVFPLSLLISVARFNLFDIDRVLSAAASYNIVLVVLGAGALVVVPRLAEAASGFLGIDPGTGQVALSLLLVGVVIPAHRRLRPQIDRVFFKDRFALDHGIAELLPSLSACEDTFALTQRAGEGINRLVKPETCVVYGTDGGPYAPIFVEGRAVPPVFETTSELIATLRNRRKPLSLGDAGRRADEAPLGPFDRAALETLGAEVVAPVHHGDVLRAFVCLGPKRSGDVYTSSDLSLFSAVAERVTMELRRFDDAKVISEGREMQESLRRYVPGAIAEQLASGEEMASGEREVSVLFVDIRGYSAFSESRKAEEIFSAVNRYTETVSQIVRKHGGSVVEFNGDGMMTVFGAPRALDQKERAAVAAGREIVAAVEAIPIGEGEGAATKLSVGVGIATGEAFVGNIQAVDRMIWSAIGNTTNLAARLQGLTREWDSSLVIDAATWGELGSAGQDFVKHAAIPIRGRQQIEDLYALPLGG
jgi:class 3 adenylate cyclase